MDELITEARVKVLDAELAERGIGADRIITVLQLRGQSMANPTMPKFRVLYRGEWHSFRCFSPGAAESRETPPQVVRWSPSFTMANWGCASDATWVCTTRDDGLLRRNADDARLVPAPACSR